MSSPKASSSPKSSTHKKTGSNTSSPRKLLTANYFFETQASIFEKFEKTIRNEIMASTPSNRRKETPVPMANTPQDLKEQNCCYGSQESVIKLFSLEMPSKNCECGEDQNLRDEIHYLRADLAHKSQLIEELTRENGTLRKEMVELQGTVEEAKSKITRKLREDYNLITELQAEIAYLREENQEYQENLQKISKELVSKQCVPDVEDDMAKYYQGTKQKVNEFYSRLNGQIMEFLNSSKVEYESFSNSIQTKLSQTMQTMIDNSKIAAQQDEKTPSQRKTRRINLKKMNTLALGKVKSESSTQSTASPLLVNLEKMCSDTTVHIKQRRATINSLDEIGMSTRSDLYSAVNSKVPLLGVLKKVSPDSSPKAAKSKVTFRTETFRSDDDIKFRE